MLVLSIAPCADRPHGRLHSIAQVRAQTEQSLRNDANSRAVCRKTVINSVRSAVGDPPRRNAHNDVVGRDIPRDDSAGGDYSAPSDGDAGGDDHASAEPNIVLDRDRCGLRPLQSNRLIKLRERVVIRNDGDVRPENNVVADREAPSTRNSAVASDAHALARP